MERLLAQTVARQNQFSFVFVVDGKAEHTAQLLHAFGAHFLVEVNDDFGVRLRVEAMAALSSSGRSSGKL